MASWALIIQGILCISIGTFGYLSFGNNTKSDVLNNYSLDELIIIFVRILYTITMAFIFPTAYVPPLDDCRLDTL